MGTPPCPDVPVGRKRGVEVDRDTSGKLGGWHGASTTDKGIATPCSLLGHHRGHLKCS